MYKKENWKVKKKIINLKLSSTKLLFTPWVASLEKKKALYKEEHQSCSQNFTKNYYWLKFSTKILSEASSLASSMPVVVLFFFPWAIIGQFWQKMHALDWEAQWHNSHDWQPTEPLE